MQFFLKESAAKLFTKLSDALMQQAQDGVDGGVIEHVAREGVYGQSNVLKASSMTVRTLVDPGHVPQVRHKRFLTENQKLNRISSRF